jgi:hypothetical protein
MAVEFNRSPASRKSSDFPRDSGFHLIYHPPFVRCLKGQQHSIRLSLRASRRECLCTKSSLNSTASIPGATSAPTDSSIIAPPFAKGGRVVWFNFDLAREMHLIPANHAHRLTSALEQAILETFSLRIINEYDLAHGTNLDDKSVRPGAYMATRYLQAQHKDKRGLTSGDGRAIWNGTIKTGKVTWIFPAAGPARRA